MDLYSSTVGKNQGILELASIFLFFRTAIIAVMMAAQFPNPPISATNLPPGTRAVLTPETTFLGFWLIQWRAAFEKTASNSVSNLVINYVFDGRG